MSAEIAMIMVFEVEQQTYRLPLTASMGFGLTPRESGMIKQLASGTAGVNIMESVQVGDIEVLTALCIVAMNRAGVDVNVDRLLDGITPIDSIDVEDPQPDGPPPVAAVVPPASPSTSPATSMTPGGTGIL